jgi:hypothetical protein
MSPRVRRLPAIRQLCLGLLAGAGLLFTPAFAWQSSVVKIAPDGQLTYPFAKTGDDKEDPEQNRIPDYSNAGYQGANKDLPDTTKMREVGVIRSGSTLAQINQAIADAPVTAANPGVLRMEAGTYEFSGTIAIRKSGLILRGAGNGLDGKPATIIKQTSMTDDVVVIDMTSGNGDNFAAKVAGSETEIITPRVLVGSREFRVANPALFKRGDVVIINHPCTPEWENKVDPGNLWDSIDIKLGNIRYHRYVVDVRGDTLEIDAPVFNHLDRALSVSTVYKYGRTVNVKESAIENMVVLGARRTQEKDDKTGRPANGTEDAVRLAGVENCWVRDLVVKNAARAGIVFSSGTTRSTAFRCRVTDPSGEEIGGNWYGFTVQVAQLILMEECFSANQRHAFICNGTVYDSGIVVYNSIMDRAQSPSEMHRYWGQGMLFDNCKVTNPQSGHTIAFYNRGDAGTNHGWASAHSTIWRCDGGGSNFAVQDPVTAQNYAIGNLNCNVTGGFRPDGPGPKGREEGTGVAGLEPASLYMAQLNARLTKTPPPATVSAPTFTPAPGSYTGSQNVTLASATTGASIRYTLDGSDPAVDKGTVYGGAFSVNVTTTIKAIAYKSGLTPSAVVTGQYTIGQIPVVVKVTGVTVSPATLTLTAGATGSLTATVAPANATNKKVTWKSDSDAVATVSTTGVVTAVAAGKTFIRVTTEDGAFVASAEIDVTATPPPTGTPITLPFVKDGAGDFTWVLSTSQIKLFNSWNLTKLEINGVDYTNKWSSTLPAPAADGKYYIRYSGAFAWSHFEIFAP